MSSRFPDVERDVTDICARLLRHGPISAFVSRWAFNIVHAEIRTDEEVVRRKQARIRHWQLDSDDVDYDDSEDEKGDPRSMWNNILNFLGMFPGNSQCTCSTTDVRLGVLSYVHSRVEQSHTGSAN